MSTPHCRLSEIFLRAVANGLVDPVEERGIESRMVILRARYGHIDHMAALLDNAREAHHEALARAEVAADRAILESLIDGTGDLLSEETFPRLEPMFSKYAVGSDMYALLEQAATAFSDAAEELAAWVLAGRVVDEARRN